MHKPRVIASIAGRYSVAVMGSMDTGLLDGGIEQQHDIARPAPLTMPLHSFNRVFGHATS